MIDEENELMSFRQALTMAFDGAQIQKSRETDDTYYLIIHESLYFQKANGLRDVCRESFDELNKCEWKIREYPKQKPTYPELKLLMRRTVRQLEVVIDYINKELNK